MKRISIVLLLAVSIAGPLGAMQSPAKRARVSPDERRFEAAKRQLAGISHSFAAKKYCDAQMVVLDKVREMVRSKLDACTNEEALGDFFRELPLLFADVASAMPVEDMAICTGVLGTAFMKSFVERVLQMQQEHMKSLVAELRVLPPDVLFQDAKNILSRQINTLIDRMKQQLKAILFPDGDGAVVAVA